MQKALNDTGNLLLCFHKQLSRKLDDSKLYWTSHTHVRGVTYFIKNHKAFMMLDVRQKHISILFFTGNGKIKGLEKGNWRIGGDNMGSKRSIIADEIDFARNIKFALEAYKITYEWTLHE